MITPNDLLALGRETDPSTGRLVRRESAPLGSGDWVLLGYDRAYVIPKATVNVVTVTTEGSPRDPSSQMFWPTPGSMHFMVEAHPTPHESLGSAYYRVLASTELTRHFHKTLVGLRA